MTRSSRPTCSPICSSGGSREVVPCRAAVSLALVVAAPASAQLPDNSLIQVVNTAPVYRVVGGAPIWLSDCAYIPEGCGAVVDDRQPRSAIARIRLTA